MHRIVAALAGCVWAVLVPAAATAQLGTTFQDAPFEITADTIDYERARDVYVARGNVKVVQEETTLTSDWLSFSRTGGRGVASGNVVYNDGVDTVYANFVEFNVTTIQGVLFVARFDDSNNRFRMEGDEIVKTGDDTYTFQEGMFTTCRCPDEGKDPWQIRADRADLELDGYAVARNTTLNILGVPILWLPWMAYPLKSDRESGFLFPEFGFRNRSGFMVGLPFFWAAAPNVGVRLTPRWFEKRGFKGDVEVEYLLGEDSSGRIFGAFIRDEAIDPDSAQDPFDRERWATRGRQDIHLPWEVRLKSEFHVVSDNRYPSDFLDLVEFRRDRYLHSEVFATRHFGATGVAGVVGGVRMADDLQSPDDQDRDPFMLQRLPEVDASVLAKPLTQPWLERVSPSLDVEYTHYGQFQDPGELFDSDPVGDDLFYDVGFDALEDNQGFLQNGVPIEIDVNEDDAPGGPEGDGVFQEGEPLADRGHRLMLTPRIAVPWRLFEHFELYPEIGWRQRLYHTRGQGFAAWGSFLARAELRTRLRRSYGEGIVHIMEPHLGYAALTTPGLGSEPLFVPFAAVPQQRIRQLDLDAVTLDPSDRVEDFNGVTWGVRNRVWIPGTVERGPRLLGDVTIGTQLDFANGADMGLMVIDGTGYPWPGVETRFNLGFDPEEFQLTEALLELAWDTPRGLTIEARYRYLRRIPQFFEDFRFDDDRFDELESDFNRVSQASLDLGYLLWERWRLGYRIAYSFESSILLTNRASVEYLSQCNCWALGLEVRQNRQLGLEFNVIYRIVGLGNDPTTLSEGGLDDFGFLDGL